MQTIKVSMRLLAEQINVCDAFSELMTNPETSGLFGGIANLLSEISCAIGNQQDIKFEVVEEE